VERYLVAAEHTLRSAREMGATNEELALSGMAVLTFSHAVMDRLDELCTLEDAAWIPPHVHPYAAPRILKRGVFEALEITALVPPMGASPLACIVEDLAACGVEAVFLVCAAWSLGPPVAFGDLLVPAFSVGLDGTSMHYGNAAGCVQAQPAVVDALRTACRALGVRAHVGGNASCEALYRITRQMVERYRRRGCLSMDNGEASTLFALAGVLGLRCGVLFQPYIALEQGWNPSRLADVRYRETCRHQAEVVVEAGVQLCGRAGQGGGRSGRTETGTGLKVLEAGI
jgi:uridine phosphorylase